MPHSFRGTTNKRLAGDRASSGSLLARLRVIAASALLLPLPEIVTRCIALSYGSLLLITEAVKLAGRLLLDDPDTFGGAEWRVEVTDDHTG